MKILSHPALDPNRRLDQAYGVNTVRQAVPTEVATGVLDPGRLMKGRVTSLDGSGLLTISTESGTFTASSATPLAVGREFWFQVVQAGSTPLLAEAGKANAVMNLLRVLLPAMTVGLDGLLAYSAGDVPGSDPEATRIARLLMVNAIDATADPIKLIKTVSLANQGRLPPSPPFTTVVEPPHIPPSSSDAPSPVLQKVTHLLEAHGAVNQQPAPLGGSDYFIYPIFFADQAGRGEWLFSFEQGSNDQESEGVTSNLSFYLAMTRLGDLHLSLTVRPKGVTGTFTLDSPEAATFVRLQLPQLITTLEPIAGSVVITCRSAPLTSLKSLKDDLAAKIGLERFALVDVKA